MWAIEGTAGHRYEVLGPLRVDGESGPPLRRPMQRRLLALLLLDPGADVRRDVLVERLWNGHPPSTPKNTLQAHVSGLRRLLGPDAITSTPTGYRLEVGSDAVDAEHLHDLVGRARAARAAGALEDALGHCERGLALWRGPPFPDLADGAFAQPVVTRLSELHAEAHELRAGFLVTLERWDEAVAAAEAAVHAHPYRERLWEHLMLALHNAGRRAEALSAFRRAHDHLLDHGISPGTGLERLHERLLRDGAAAATPAGAQQRTARPLAAAGGVDRRRWDWDFLGRAPELEAAQRVLAGSGPGVVLVGPAGVGKSRLLYEIALRAERLGIATVPVRANASLARIPLGAVSSLASLTSEPLHAQFQRLVDAIAALATATPPLLLVDDAHHLDGPSSAVVTRALESGVARVVATVRSDLPTPPTVTRWWTGGGLERRLLGPLRPREVDTLVEQALGRCTDPTRRRLRELASGNPLHLREILLAARDIGALVREDSGWKLAGPVAGADRLTELVDLAARRLGHGRRALEALAVVRPLARAVLEEAVGPEAVGALEASGLARCAADEHGMEVIDVEHPLHAENLAARLTATQRRDLALEIGAALERAGFPLAGDELRAALLLLEADPDHLSQELAVRACRQALARLDVDLALRLAEVATSRGQSVDAWVLRGRALAYAGNLAEADRVLQVAQDLAPGGEAVAEIACERATHRGFGLRDPEGAMALLDAAQHRLGAGPGAARVRVERAVQLALSGSLRSALDEVRTAEHETLPDATRLSAAMVRTLALSLLGDVEGLVGEIDALLPLAEAARERFPLARDQVYANKVMALTAAGRVQEAVAVASEQWRRAVESGGLVSLWRCYHLHTLELAGRIPEAVRLLEAPAGDRGADPFSVAFATSAMAALALAQDGRASEAAALLDASWDERALQHPRDAVWWRRARAWTIPDRSEAAAAVLEAAEGAIAADHLLWGAFACYDAVRFGAAGAAAGTLARVAEAGRGAALVETLAAAAAAHAAEDADLLLAAGDRLAAHGTGLLAAEAFGQAARVAGEGARCVVARTRQRDLLVACGLEPAGASDLHAPGC